jgi:trimethylamine--corrinoid protein Co-methyltransferase
VIYGLGMLEMGITFDFGQLVMDNDFAGMIKHAVRGIPVNDDTLSVDIIHEVGPFKEFVSHENTYQNMRITSRPKLIDRSRRDDWKSKGARDLYGRATEEARRILETHKPPRLPETAVAEIQGIIRETEAELGVGKGAKRGH